MKWFFVFIAIQGDTVNLTTPVIFDDMVECFEFREKVVNHAKQSTGGMIAGFQGVCVLSNQVKVNL